MQKIKSDKLQQQTEMFYTRIAFFIFCSCFISVTAWATPINAYLSVKAKEGDGVFSLLRRYHLEDYGCNLDEFYSINRLKTNAELFSGKSYRIPILLFDFDGKSLKTSLNRSDNTLLVHIEDYNEQVLRDKLKAKSFKQDKVLWVPYHELFCSDDKEKTEEPAPKKKPIVSNIFGETVKVKTKILRGKAYYIDAGHGGPDPGAMAKWQKHSICEDEYAYDVSIRLAKYLTENGAQVYMITQDDDDGIRAGQYLPCDSDEVCIGNERIPLNQKMRLQQRTDAINRLFIKNKKKGIKDQKLIVIHVDSRGKREQTDVFFYYKPNSETSEKLAMRMQNTFANNYPSGRGYEGEVSKRDLFLLRETKPVSVYVELGNIQNAFDQQRILSENNRQVLAKWLYEGLTGGN